MVTRTVTDAATFAAALAISVGGDVISCAAGTYGVVTSSKKFTSQMRVVSTNPASPAIFTKFDLDNAAYWSLEDLKLANPYQSGFTITDGSMRCWYSDNISVLRCEIFNGNIPATGFQYGSAIYCLFATNLTVNDCRIRTCNIGLNLSNITGVSINRNEIYDIGIDGIDLFEVRDGSVDGNYIHDFRTDYYSGSHNDFIQVASYVNEIVPRNLSITNNILDIGQGSWVQNILSQSEAFDGTNTYRLQGMVYSGNKIRGSFTYGIKCGIGTSFVCENNIISWVPANPTEPYNVITTNLGEHQGFTSTQSIPKIFIEVSSLPSIVRNNTFYGGPFYAGPRIDWGGSTEAALIAAGWTISSNVTYKDTVAPPNPVFLTYFGGGGVVPTVVNFGPSAVTAVGGY